MVSVKFVCDVTLNQLSLPSVCNLQLKKEVAEEEVAKKIHFTSATSGICNYVMCNLGQRYPKLETSAPQDKSVLQ